VQCTGQMFLSAEAIKFSVDKNDLKNIPGNTYWTVWSSRARVGCDFYVFGIRK